MKGFFFVLFHFIVNSCIAQRATTIIPQPVSMHVKPGYFIIDNHTCVIYKEGAELGNAAFFFSNAIRNISGTNIPINKPARKVIELKMEVNLSIGEEGYILVADSTKITIKAHTKAGIIYGIQTLLQTLPAIRTNARLQIPCMEITDFPRFKYRGMHLDVSRHFFNPEFVKHYIDLLAAYKMNIFHWHLVDDQGWRIEIKKYPELTSIGAWRVDHTDKIWGNRPPAKKGEEATYGGYYTQDQIREIVQYAMVRNVTIIPEIEMPGHVASAISAYPQLSCARQFQLPLTGGNYTGSSSNYCAGNDDVFAFLENVLSEVVLLFPSPYIHIGGDEVDKSSWEKCMNCQARIKKEGLKNEDELQSYFIRRIETFLSAKKRKIIGWDEILEGGLAPRATVMSWRGEAGGVRAAKMKHDVVMTPGKPVYFDHYQAGPEGEPVAIGGMNTLKNVYDYEPVPASLTADESKYVLGAQANLWTEYISTAEQAEYMLLPRLLALAEVLWIQKEDKNWNRFNHSLQQHEKVFGQKGIRYCQGNFKVLIKPELHSGKLYVSLSSELMNGDIYYTTDGSEPVMNSMRYSSPFEVSTSMVLKASVALEGRILGTQAARQQFVLHKAIAKNVSYHNPVSQSYMADGPLSLTDGIRGSTIIGRFWHGFSSKDFIATIDLKTNIPIQSISLGCLQKYNDWIYLPQSVKFETSLNGIDYETVDMVESPYSTSEKELLYDFRALFIERVVRYVRVTAKNNICPPGHSGAGKPGWIFADEIVVE